MVRDYSSDGNWCFEWLHIFWIKGRKISLKLQSTSSPSTNYNISKRICSENKICAFIGEFLKYKYFDTSNNFETIVIIEFKEKVNEGNIKFFVDGFGNKSLTCNLNLKTGIETHSQYDTKDFLVSLNQSRWK